MSINYLQNAQVLVVLNDSPVHTLAGAPIEHTDNAIALMDLDNKALDAVVMDVVAANYCITVKHVPYRIPEKQLAPEYCAIGFRKTDASLGRMSRHKVISAPVSFYILIMRGTPLMLQLFAVYFFLPKLIGPIPRLNAVYIAFGLNYAAYFAEIYRGGIMSIPPGQYK